MTEPFDLHIRNRRRIYLMRHGEAAYVSPDGVVTSDPRAVPLTAEGRQQANLQGQVLSGIGFDRAICSGLRRTRETAEHVLAQNSSHRVPRLEIIGGLEEIQGMRGERAWPPASHERNAALADIANPWARGASQGARFLGGELFSDFETRVQEAWQNLIGAEDWKCLLVVAHGGVNRMILNLLTGLPWRGDLCFEQDNGCINIIDIDPTSPPRYLIRAINITAYNLSKSGIVMTNMEATAQRVAAILKQTNPDQPAG